MSRTAQQEHDIELFRRVIDEGFNRGNLAALDAMFTPDFREHQRGFPTPDLAGLKRGIGGLRRALPDLRLEVVDTLVEDDRVCFLLSGEGTHEGQLGPIPGSGKQVTWEVIDICRFRGGLIAEHWGIPDRMGIMEQVGLPQPPRWLMKLMLRRKK